MKVSEVIARALRLIKAHPATKDILGTTVDAETGAVAVEILVRLGLPNAWMADGVSPNGVRAYEPVILVFTAAFPLRPPIIYLRSDFDRSLAHVNPGPADELPVPCIYEGLLSELLQQQGLGGILNQLVLWLENAALGTLIDPKHGWEPVRRDSLRDFIVADAAHLRAFVKRDEGHAAFRFDYLRYAISDGEFAIHGEIGKQPLALNREAIGELFKESESKDGDVAVGHAMSLVVWPGKHPSGQPVIAGQYRPETVTNYGKLVERATAYGCAAPLRGAISWLERCVSGYSVKRPFPIAVVLCARRPWHLIGSDSQLELCPYLVEISAPQLFPAGNATPVRPAGHRHAIAVPLLRRLSGDDRPDEALKWIQLGAGSLGSKIALHLARAGRAPNIVIDHGNLSPHNAVRHALIPAKSTMQISWIRSKAQALVEAIEGLGQPATGHVEDIVTVLGNPDLARRLLPKKCWAVVNSTASLNAREALASAASVQIPRVIETSLFAQGRLGLVAVEGPGRNPNMGDLIAEAYALMRDRPELRRLVFANANVLERQLVGEGCGSATMVMSDARISAFAASMAEAISTLQRTGLPANGGRILLGAIAEDGMSQAWQAHEIPSCVTVSIDQAPSWSVRIANRAHRKIVDEVTRWPVAETGGILVGRFSEAAQAFYIVDVLPAPEDSRRSAAEFVLGTRGVRAAVKDYAESCNYSLYCLGTWHSHLQASGPSSQDRATAEAVALARLMPSVLLIHTPAGYRAVLAEPPSDEGAAAGTSN